MSQQPLNAVRAEQLKRKRLTWRLVGITLALEEGRTTAYAAESVARAVKQLRARRYVP